MKTKRLFKVILFATSLTLLWASRSPVSSLWRWFSDRDAVYSSMADTGIWGPLVLFVLFVLQVFLAFIPGQALMVACGYLYGFWGGFLLSWLSLVAGGEIAFILARRYGRAFADKWISPDLLARWDRTAQGQGISFFVISLVMPLMPNDAMCYVAGLGRIPHRRFSIANLIGRGIACIFTSATGAFGADVPWQVWMVLIAIVLGGSIAWLINRNHRSYFLAGQGTIQLQEGEPT